MDPITRVAMKVAHRFGIYPHDGKKVIFIRNGEFHEGVVIGSAAFTGYKKLSDMDGIKRMNIRNEAAEALGVTPAKILRRLTKGEMVMYRPPGELK